MSDFNYSLFDSNSLRELGVRSFFKVYKNPKVYMFYEELAYLTLKLKPQTGLIVINQSENKYNFDVTDKTIQNWLKHLQKLGLISFKYKKFDLLYLQMKDYTKLKIFEKRIYERTGQPVLPTRFYKDVQLIIKNAIKEFKGKKLLFQGEKLSVCDFSKKHELAFMESVYVNMNVLES
ncbi:hypothetical protein [Helicobacter sp. 13S00477-4]|uniref:hypothetical protein n=1 Tax=Helicobacter sp. 13S00477-4 TaxID=1905759 RepID=UPI000BA5A074|nr:hypothetical protein [Helicobacter sp. 13S00477-4]PAF50644.1 hypothetical protein BKH44_07315 [Helicobacter sp. 13S00477-4]